MKNARVIYEGLKSAGYTVSGGVNAPYIWLKTPEGMNSWEFFDHLLENCKRGRNPRLRLRSQRRRILPADSLWNV